MMKEPKLLSDQFAVVMADCATGHVLTTQGNVYHNDDKEVFMIFDDLNSARNYIERKQNENDTLEFVIYNSNFEVIEHREALKEKK